MGKYKVPLEKRKEKEKFQKDMQGLLNTMIIYVVVGFVSMFITAGAIALFISAGANVPQSLILSGFVTGIFASFITLLIVGNSNNNKTK